MARESSSFVPNGFFFFFFFFLLLLVAWYSTLFPMALVHNCSHLLLVGLSSTKDNTSKNDNTCKTRLLRCSQHSAGGAVLVLVLVAVASTSFFLSSQLCRAVLFIL